LPVRILANHWLGEAKKWQTCAWLRLLIKDVVVESLETLASGGGLVIPDFVNKLSVFAQRLFPRRAVPKLVAKIARLMIRRALL
jgi:hypothetical protein